MRRYANQDHSLLAAIQDDYTTTRELTDMTTLDRRQINYALKQKLAELGFVEYESPHVQTETTVNGQTRRHRQSSQYHLTALGTRYLTWADEQKQWRRFHSADWDTLTEQMQENTEPIHTVEARLEQFWQQMVRELAQLKDGDP